MDLYVLLVLKLKLQIVKSAMQQEKFSLTSHAYSDHQRKILHDLLETNDFADVTLVCDDLKQIKAHRNILSACSPVFKTMLHIETNNSHPVIYLRGIQYTEMESIIQYIYQGKATFLQERLSDLLSTAKSLQIRELANSVTDEKPAATGSQEDKEVLQNKEDLQEDTQSAIKLEPTDVKIFNSIEQELHYHDDVIYPCRYCPFESKTLKYLKKHNVTQHGVNKYLCKQCDFETEYCQNLTKHIRKMHHDSAPKYMCTYCDYQAKEKSHLKMHIGKHEGITYNCTHCDYKATEPPKLTKHVNAKHLGIKYDCNHCDFQSGYRYDLTKHIKSIHEGIWYSCEQCDFKASTNGALNAHIKSRHAAKAI